MPEHLGNPVLATKAELDARLSVRRKAVTGDFILNSPSPEGSNILEDTFTPYTSSVPITVNFSPVCYDAGGVTMGARLHVGPVADLPFQSNVYGEAPPAGVQTFEIGGAEGYKPGGLSRRLIATGLTPGEEYAYELIPLILGGSLSLSASDGPLQMATSRTRNMPAPWVAAVYCWGAGNVQRVDIFCIDETSIPYGDRRIGSVLLPDTAAAHQIAMTPNGAKAVVTHYSNHKVYIVNTGAPIPAAAAYGLVWGAPALQGSYTVPGTTPQPAAVACTADNLYAWIVTAGTDRLIRLTLADGTMAGPNYDVAGTEALDIVLSPDDAYAYIADGASKTVRRVRLSDGVVTHTYTSPDSGASLKALEINTLGTKLYVSQTGGGNKIRTLNAADLTSAASVSAAGVNVLQLALHDDERSIWTADYDSTGPRRIRQVQLPSGTEFHGWGGSTAGQASMAVLPTGAILVPNSDNDTLGIWPGGEMKIVPNSPYVTEFGSYAEVIVERAA